MPTYEYECLGCRRVFEVRQRISAPPLETCDTCGAAVRRLLSAAPFILKGDGWYVTDYPSKARKQATAEEKSSPATSSPAASPANGGSGNGKSENAASPPAAAAAPAAAS